MASTMQSIASEEEIAAIIARPKYLASDIEWTERPERSIFKQYAATLLDEAGATIPGLTVELFYRRSSSNDCLYRFTVFLLRGNKKGRIYQIEAMPNDRVLHWEDGVPWFGPHQHFGERAAKFDVDPTFGCDDHQGWFNFFLILANIQFSGRYFPPPEQLRLDMP